MGRFSYKAVDDAGGHVSGVIEAADRRSAVASLAVNGQFVLELTEEMQEAGKGSKGDFDFRRFLGLGKYRVTSKDILAITGQMNAALRAGLPLLNALEIIGEQQHKTATKEMVGELATAVRGGQSLSEAMARNAKVFSPLYISMIRVGEHGGILDRTTGQLMGLLDRDEKVKASIRNASAYPIFILGLGIVSVVIVVTWILPKILATLSGGDVVLPLPTRILLGLSGFIRSYGLLVFIAIVAGVYGLKKWVAGKGRVKWDAFKLKIPVLGPVLRAIAVGRFARTLGELTKGGVTILESLGIVRDTLGNEFLGRAIDDVTEQVKAGSSLGGPLSKTGYFPPLLVQIVAMGEQTGKLDELLLNAADTFDEEANTAINQYIAIFPAVLILLVALVIGFIIAATLMPIVMMELGAGL